MTTKEIVRDLLEHLPDDISLEEVAEKVRFVAAVREGIESYEREGGISLEEVEALIPSWARSATV